MKKAVKVWALILAMLLALSSFAGCGGTEEETAAPAQAESAIEVKEEKAETEELGDIVIGYIGPLTGEGALWGEMEKNTVQLLVDKTNENGGILGRKVVLKAYDNRMDTVETTNAARKAIQSDKVVAIIGTNSSGASIALAEVCEEFKVPHLTTTATNPSVTKHDDGTVRPYTFRVSQNDNQLGVAIAHYAYETMGIRSAAALVEISSDYSVGVTEVFRETFTSLGGTITTEEGYKGGDVDYRAQLSKIIASNPEALFLPSSYKEMGLASNQIRELGFTGDIIGPDCWLMYELFTVATTSVDGATFVTGVNIADPVYEPFRQEYYAAFGSYPDTTNSYYAHDAYNLIKYAIEATGGATSEDIVEGLNGATDVELITGLVTIPETHDPIRNAYVCVIQDSDFTFPDVIRITE